MVLILVAGVIVAPWVPIVGIAVALLYAWDLHRALARFETKGLSLGNLVLDQFKAGDLNATTQTLAWTVGLLIVLIPLAVRRYRNRT